MLVCWLDYDCGISSPKVKVENVLILTWSRHFLTSSNHSGLNGLILTPLQVFLCTFMFNYFRSFVTFRFHQHAQKTTLWYTEKCKKKKSFSPAVYKWMVATEVNVKSVSLFSLLCETAPSSYLHTAAFSYCVPKSVSHTDKWLDMMSSFICIQDDSGGECIKQHITLSEKIAQGNTLYHYTARVQVPLAVDHHLLTNLMPLIHQDIVNYAITTRNKIN